jgi:hypothetical protein
MRSDESKLTDVLRELNPKLTRHQAYARAARILVYARHADDAEYSARLFMSALRGTKRVGRTWAEEELGRLVATVVRSFPWGKDEPINGGDCVEFMGEWVVEARPILAASANP